MSNKLSNWSVYTENAQGQCSKQHRFQHQVGQVQIKIRGFDHSLGFGEVECADMEMVKKSHVIATVLSAIMLDPTCIMVNYDHPNWTEPLKQKRLWTNAWAIIKPCNEQQDIHIGAPFDMATAIQGYYLNGNNSLGQAGLITGMPNRFCFGKTNVRTTCPNKKAKYEDAPELRRRHHRQVPYHVSRHENLLDPVRIQCNTRSHNLVFSQHRNPIHNRRSDHMRYRCSELGCDICQH